MTKQSTFPNVEQQANHDDGSDGHQEQTEDGLQRRVNQPVHDLATPTEQCADQQPELTLPAIRRKVFDRDRELFAAVDDFVKAAKDHARVRDSNRVFLKHHGFGGKR